MKLALFQSAPADHSFERAEALLHTVARQGADVLVLPELFFPGYNRSDLHHAEAQPIAGAWMDDLRTRVAGTGCALVFGWAERSGSTVYNAASCIGADGAILSHYRKVQLFGDMERASFTAGDHLSPTFQLAGRTCGILICYDIEFPGHAATLARAGAEVIFVPTANPEGYEHVQEVLVPARAHENRAFVAYANSCGAENGIQFGGGSVIAGPDGRALARAGMDETLLIVDLPKLTDYPPEALSIQGTEFRPAPIK